MFFKEKIYRKELKRFIIEGLLTSIIFGTLLGAFNFFLRGSAFDFFTIFTFIILYIFLVKRLYQSFHFYHITYSILAIFFLFLGDYFVVSSTILVTYFSSAKVIWLGAFNPIYYIRSMFFLELSAIGIIYDVLHVLIYILISYSIFMRMKR